MKKIVYLWICVVLIMAACATKMHIGNFDLDTRTLPADSIVKK